MRTGLDPSVHGNGASRDAAQLPLSRCREAEMRETRARRYTHAVVCAARRVRQVPGVGVRASCSALSKRLRPALRSQDKASYEGLPERGKGD